MMRDPYEPKPDDRSDNAEKLQDMIGETLQNMDETEERIDETSHEEAQHLKKKNERRKEAIEGYRNEIQDELEQ